jgi:transposase
MDDSSVLLLEPVGQAPFASCSPASTTVALLSDEYLPIVAVPSSTEDDDSEGSDTGVAGRLLRENLELRQQVGYWKSMHQRTLARLSEREAEVEQLQAKLKLRERQLFGRKSEKGRTQPDGKTLLSPVPGVGQRRRGQQRGQPQPLRRNYDHLPVEEQFLDIAADVQHCSCCGLPWQEFPSTVDSEELEIEVRPYRRRYRRRRYRPTCACGTQPGIITAPGPDKLLPKSRLGISIWVTVLLDKYAFARPTHRLLEDLRTQGLDLSASTLAEGLQRLTPLLTPLYQAMVLHQRQEEQWHADETRWSVFICVEGKAGHRWYLWLFRSRTAVVFVLDPGRAHDVPEEHFGPDARGILIVDRYSAYKAMAQVKAGQIVLAFCWAHQRRDFIGLANDWPTLEAWALSWIEAIGELYHLNAQRLEVRKDAVAFARGDQALRQAVDAFGQRWQTELQQPDLHPACQRVLTSLQEHWQGLTVFVNHPEVPMDNNAGERTIRDPAMGRKNYFGCGSLWSVQLAVSLFSLVATLRIWHINPRLWFTAYFEACAANGGQVPDRAESFLPWNLTAEQRQAFQAEESDLPLETFNNST